jgi:hypothetical protein
MIVRQFTPVLEEMHKPKALIQRPCLSVKPLKQLQKQTVLKAFYKYWSRED